MLATEVIFSVLICLCVMSDIRLSPSLEVRAACKNPLLAKSGGPCARFSALCGFEEAARLNLSLVVTAEVRDDLLDDPTSRLLARLALSSILQCTCNFYNRTCPSNFRLRLCPYGFSGWVAKTQIGLGLSDPDPASPDSLLSPSFSLSSDIMKKTATRQSLIVRET